MISQHDRDLIEEAESLGYTEWGYAFKLAEQAESEAAKERITNRAKWLWHTEEFHADGIC